MEDHVLQSNVITTKLFCQMEDVSVAHNMKGLKEMETSSIVGLIYVMQDRF